MSVVSKKTHEKPQKANYYILWSSATIIHQLMDTDCTNSLIWTVDLEHESKYMQVVWAYCLLCTICLFFFTKPHLLGLRQLVLVLQPQDVWSQQQNWLNENFNTNCKQSVDCSELLQRLFSRSVISKPTCCLEGDAVQFQLCHKPSANTMTAMEKVFVRVNSEGRHFNKHSFFSRNSFLLLMLHPKLIALFLTEYSPWP